MAVLGFFGFFLLATNSALIPLMLQSVMNYPALSSGMLMIPRGVGATFATMAAGRLMGRVDPRLLILTGLSFCALSLWLMTHFDLTMGRREILTTAFIQGLGFGFIMVPVTTFAFATLPVALRAEGAALSSVLRNLGGSMGIAAMGAMLVRQGQTVHASLAAHIIPSDPVVRASLAAQALDPATAKGALALDAAIVRQAAMIAYLDVFKLMFFVALACAPLLLIVRVPRRREVGAA
jgi:DHA2 family multidrug resistance protein